MDLSINVLFKRAIAYNPQRFEAVQDDPVYDGELLVSGLGQLKGEIVVAFLGFADLCFRSLHARCG